jgi:hypothetical protein
MLIFPSFVMSIRTFSAPAARAARIARATSACRNVEGARAMAANREVCLSRLVVDLAAVNHLSRSVEPCRPDDAIRDGTVEHLLKHCPQMLVRIATPFSRPPTGLVPDRLPASIPSSIVSVHFTFSFEGRERGLWSLARGMSRLEVRLMLHNPFHQKFCNSLTGCAVGSVRPLGEDEAERIDEFPSVHRVGTASGWVRGIELIDCGHERTMKARPPI